MSNHTKLISIFFTKADLYTRVKSYLYICILLLLPVLSWAQGDIPELPNPPRMVTDLAGVLSTGEQHELEQVVRAYNDTSSTEIAVVLVPTYGNYDRADFTFRLAKKWKIGKKGKNNGLLITIAVNDRKYFIATGYGLEGSIPDIVVYQVGEKYLKPNFKVNKYYEGIRGAVEYLAALPGDEFKADPKEDSGKGSGWIIFIVILFIVLFVVLPMINRNKGGGRGGYRGGGGYTPPFIVFGSGGSSSGWGGGSDGGGGGSDFGGFGGGDFGGGGAGGDW